MEVNNKLTERECLLFDAAWGLVMSIRGGGTPPFMTADERANAVAPMLLGILPARNQTALDSGVFGDGTGRDPSPEVVGGEGSRDEQNPTRGEE